ncbi:hypothetical protein [Streptomyces sp. CAU 1734]|uniref:hypothetical protein n=1 Tax=Streptomyces sp. CAU 1734 TaxID=3140360 RepID=UPI00326157B1
MASSVHGAALWIDTLDRQFPELLAELAPGGGSPSPGRTGRTRATHPAAPLRLHVSDTVRDITDGVVELDEAVHEKLGLGRPRRARVPQRLARIAGLLDSAAAHPELIDHIRDEARRMAGRCARVLGDTECVVRLGGRCPWCDSVSLRAFPARRAVLCVNPGCRCADGGCACDTDPAHRHTWRESEWAVLAGTGGAEIAASMDEAAQAGEGVRG